MCVTSVKEQRPYVTGAVEEQRLHRHPPWSHFHTHPGAAGGAAGSPQSCASAPHSLRHATLRHAAYGAHSITQKPEVTTRDNFGSCAPALHSFKHADDTHKKSEATACESPRSCAPAPYSLKHAKKKEKTTPAPEAACI
eukprot:scaffold176411_cov24-Tisochrysis_lutea.AAC.3